MHFALFDSVDVGMRIGKKLIHQYKLFGLMG